VAAVADLHRVKTPTPLEFPPPTVRPAARPTTWDWLVLYVARPLWGVRGELAAALAVLLAWRWLAGLLGRGAAAVLLAAVVGGLLAVPAVRRRVMQVEHRARVRRRWAAACRYAGLASASDRVPRIVRHRLVPAGDRLLVRLPAGSSTAALAEAAEQVAVILDVREVRVARDPDRAALARVTVVRRDPLHTATPLAWPLLGAPRCSLWLPVPVGVDEDGQWVHVALPERNLLLGGEPGSGKSAAMALLLAAAALDPSVRLILLDGKLVELACWAGVADRSVGADLHQAIEVLAEVQAELDRRLLVLLANRRRKLTPSLGMPLLLVVIDELAFYVAGPDRKLAAEFAGRLRDLVAGGRDHHPRGDAEAGRRGAPHLAAGPVRVPLGAALPHPPSLGHGARPGLGQPRLQRLRGGRGRPGGRAAAGRGRRAGQVAGLLAGRRPAPRPRRPRRKPPGGGAAATEGAARPGRVRAAGRVAHRPQPSRAGHSDPFTAERPCPPNRTRRQGAEGMPPRRTTRTPRAGQRDQGRAGRLRAVAGGRARPRHLAGGVPAHPHRPAAGRGAAGRPPTDPRRPGPATATAAVQATSTQTGSGVKGRAGSGARIALWE
jgi:hypothetical protein